MKLTEEQKEYRRRARVNGKLAARMVWRSYSYAWESQQHQQDRWAVLAVNAAIRAAHWTHLAHPELRGDDK